MKCPKCDLYLVCSCPTCRKDRQELPEGVVELERIEAEDAQMCSNCGYAMHVDGWADLEWEQMKKEVE